LISKLIYTPTPPLHHPYTTPTPPLQGIKIYNRSEIPPEFLGSKMGIRKIKNINREFLKNYFFPKLIPSLFDDCSKERSEPTLNFIA
jgi:hypothetical protein